MSAHSLTTQTPSPDSYQYYVEAFLLKHQAERHSPKTLTHYGTSLARFGWYLEYAGYPTRLADITATHIRSFFVYAQQAKEGRWGSETGRRTERLSAYSIHALARSLRAFWRWATIEADLPRNPFANVAMPKLPPHRVESFTTEEVAQLFQAADKMGRPFTVARNRAILALLLDTGLRASELLSLNVGDINFRDGTFEICGKGEKTRRVIAGAFARKELLAYITRYRIPLDTPERGLFVSTSGTRLTYSGLQQMFARLKEISGITRVDVRPHICRHTAATMAHRNGMKGAVLQLMMGHSDFTTTRAFYLDTTEDDLAAEHAQFSPLDNMGRQLRATGASGQANAPKQLPPGDVLAREVQQSSYRAVGRKYGVSDVTIRNHIKRAGLL